jgi:hypothetical protein
VSEFQQDQFDDYSDSNDNINSGSNETDGGESVVQSGPIYSSVSIIIKYQGYCYRYVYRRTDSECGFEFGKRRQRQYQQQ